MTPMDLTAPASRTLSDPPEAWILRTLAERFGGHAWYDAGHQRLFVPYAAVGAWLRAELRTWPGFSDTSVVLEANGWRCTVTAGGLRVSLLLRPLFMVWLGGPMHLVCGTPERMEVTAPAGGILGPLCAVSRLPRRLQAWLTASQMLPTMAWSGEIFQFRGETWAGAPMDPIAAGNPAMFHMARDSDGVWLSELWAWWQG